MSRALDKGVIACLNSGDSAAAYEAISRALIRPESQQQQHGELLEIEILGKSHPLEPGTFLLRDGNAIAVSKLGLVQAFFVARGKFQNYLKASANITSGSVLPDDDDYDILAATSVMLLMDPEHLTAANARKRLLVAAGSQSREQLLKVIRKEECLIDSLLTSRLHRHTKSPTLWSHRRWLAHTASCHGIRPDVVGVVRDVVMVAGERHPRNYYAWNHARWLTGLVRDEERDTLSGELLGATKGWCFRNHTDTSGWSFLYFLLTRFGGEGSSTSAALLRETTGLAASLHWANESTWVFLRVLAASGTTEDDALASFHETREALLQKVEEAEGRRVLEEARAWVETYRRRPS